jgi:alpha-galactosidase
MNWQLGFAMAVMAGPAAALVSPSNVGRLPAMGWNSWNEYGCNINESIFVTTAQKLVSTGLRDLGYVYVNVDDCWSDKVKKRDAKTKQIIPDASKFPKGISNTAAQIHALGLKMGIYGDAGMLVSTALAFPAGLPGLKCQIHANVPLRIRNLRRIPCVSRI